MTRDANKQSVECSGRHDWMGSTNETGITCSLCGKQPSGTKDYMQAEAIIRLKDWIKPGDTLYTEIKNVSRSGMSRVIQVIKISCGDNGEPSLSYLGYNIAQGLGWSYDKSREGIKVGGCGMDMGFHIIHSLGYALYGNKAEHGKGAEANALRRGLLKADKFYYTQGGQPEPNPNKPDRLWFGGAGYALKHKRL